MTLSLKGIEKALKGFEKEARRRYNQPSAWLHCTASIGGRTYFYLMENDSNHEATALMGIQMADPSIQKRRSVKVDVVVPGQGFREVHLIRPYDGKGWRVEDEALYAE